MLTVGKDGSVIENLKEILEKYLKGASSKYYPPVENLLDLIYEHYTENNSVAPQTIEAGKDAKRKEKDLETWLRGIAGMDVLVEDYGGDIPLWEKTMDRQGSESISLCPLLGYGAAQLFCFPLPAGQLAFRCVPWHRSPGNGQEVTCFQSSNGRRHNNKSSIHRHLAFDAVLHGVFQKIIV